MKTSRTVWDYIEAMEQRGSLLRELILRRAMLRLLVEGRRK